jgi:transposase
MCSQPPCCTPTRRLWRCSIPARARAKRAYVWAYARGELDAQRGVIYEFCLGRGSQYPVAFLGAQGAAWRGTLVCDQYAGYDAALDARVYPARQAAGCVAHARRKFDELARHGSSPVASEAIRRIGRIYHVEGQFAGMGAEQRRAARQELTRPLWQELRLWLELERRRVPDGGTTAAAIDYSLGNWAVLTRHLDDGAVPLDNNFLERQIKPWQMGRKNWLFAGPRAGRATCRRRHEPGAVGQAQRARSVGVPARRARALAHAAQQPHRGTPPPSLVPELSVSAAPIV